MALGCIKRNLPPYANRAKNVTVYTYFCSKVLSHDINAFIQQECVKVIKSEVKSFIITKGFDCK